MLKGKPYGAEAMEAYDGIRTFPCGTKSTCTAVFKSGPSEFIIVSKIDERSKDNLYIHRYSSKGYRYSKLQGGRGDVYPPSHLSISECVCGYDPLTKDLYIVGNQRDEYCTGSVLKSVNVESGEQTDYDCSQRNFSIKCMILIGDNIHMFGCKSSRNNHHGFTVSSKQQHRIFNIVSSKFVKIVQLKSNVLMTRIKHALLCKSRNSILIILCRISLSQNRNTPFKSWIAEYSLDTQKYQRFDWSQTDGELAPSMIIPSDGRYIVVFGREDYRKQQITVFDLRSCSVTVCDIECPFYGGNCRAVLLGGNEQDELVMFGFVREVYESAELRDVQDIPIHVL